MNQTTERNIFLRDTLTVLFKRKWVILWFTIIVFATVFVGNYVVPPTYESISKVRLMRGREVMQTDPTVTKSAAMPMVALSLEDVNSEIELIKSSRVLERVVNEMGLDQLKPKGGLLRTLYRGVKRAWYELQYLLRLSQRPTAMQAALAVLDKAVVVEHIPDSYVLEIKVHIGDPALAQAINSTLLDVYKDEHIKLFSNPHTAQFFEEQMERVAQELQSAQAKLEGFVNENALVSIAEEKNLLLQQYMDLQRLLAQLDETEVAADTGGQLTNDVGLIELLSRNVESTVVRELQLRLLELILTRNRITENVGPENPDALANTREIEKAAARLREAIAVGRSVAQKKLARVETRLKQLNELNPTLEALNREVQIKSDSYGYYAEKLEESRVLDAMTNAQITSTKVTSMPTLAVNPIKPKKLLNLALALAAGLIGGIGFAFLFEYFNHGLKTPEEVEYFLGIPMMAAFFRRFSKTQEHEEAIRLGVLLDTMTKPHSPRIIQVGSTVKGEGARVVAEELAGAYARELDAKTLFIDFSNESAGGPGVVGLTDLLLGEASLDEAVEKRGDLQMMRRGRTDELPSHVFSSGRFGAIMSDLSQRYERIVFYADPVLSGREVLKSVPFVDGHVLVIRADATRREVVQRAVERLREAGGQILGTVLTDRRQYIPTVVYRRI